MPLNTIANLKEIIETSKADAFLNIALTSAAAKIASIPEVAALDDDTKKTIEVCLAAHTIALGNMDDNGIKTKTELDVASDSFLSAKAGDGLLTTQYGVMANDASGGILVKTNIELTAEPKATASATTKIAKVFF